MNKKLVGKGRDLLHKGFGEGLKGLEKGTGRPN